MKGFTLRFSDENMEMQAEKMHFDERKVLRNFEKEEGIVVFKGRKASGLKTVKMKLKYALRKSSLLLRKKISTALRQAADFLYCDVASRKTV